MISMDYLIHIHSRAWKTGTKKKKIKKKKKTNTHQKEHRCDFDQNPSNNS